MMRNSSSDSIEGARLLLILPLCLIWACTYIRKQPVGLRNRLVPAVPIMVLCAVLPLRFQAVTLRASLMFLLTWLLNMKLFAFACGRGALHTHTELNPFQWAAMLVLPLYPAKRGRAPAQPKNAVLVYIVKVVAAAGFTLFLMSPIAETYTALRHASLTIYVWLYASLILDAPLPLFGPFLQGIPLQPSMDQPYLSRSIKELWGVRYNQIVSAILMDTVYLPVFEGRLIALGAPSGSTTSRASSGDMTPSSHGVSANGTPRTPPTVGDGSNNSVCSTSSDNSVNSCASGHSSASDASDSSLAGRLAGATTAAEDQGIGQANNDKHSSKLVHRTGLHTAEALHTVADQVDLKQQGQPERKPHAKGASGLSRSTRRWLAMYASFAVSGIMHEICTWYMMRRIHSTGKLFTFFLIQPAIIFMETGLKLRFLPPESQRSKLVRWCETFVGFITLVVLSELLMWESLEQDGLLQTGLDEMAHVFLGVGNVLKAAVGF